ncbi:MAG TPA: pitrilysin family protein [Pyrinomonadaceae bacterium]|nr:pitrilysin family protein [Pyrinomonadaceae bacterium]
MKSSRSQRPPRLPSLRGTTAAALAALLLLCAGLVNVSAQTPPQPRREKLLNGLRILLLPRPGDQTVLIKLRVHDGSAFDLANKAGMMAVLADAMFDAQTRDYVTEELDGRLEVKAGYDSVNVTLAGKASDFGRLLELARAAMMNMQLTPESVTRLRDARVKALRDAPPDAAALADRDVAARLYGTHPYGRPDAGTPESVARIERVDLLVMRDRFLTPDNTTLVIVGGFDAKEVMRTMRQSFGVWRKSDAPVPPTFAMPNPPDARTLVVNRPEANSVELRLALRGLARTDRDAPAARVLAEVIRARWLAAVPELKERSAFVKHEAYRAGGTFSLGATLRTPAEAAKALESARAIMNQLSTTAPSASELEGARQVFASAVGRGAQGDEGFAEAWLDEHTYENAGATVPEMMNAAASLSPAEAQRVAARLFFHTPVAVVAEGDAAQLRTELARAEGGVEVFGEAAEKPAAAEPQKPQQPGLLLKRPH